MRRNEGKREREAGKRRRRAVYWDEADSIPLKLGRKHSRRYYRRILQPVADAEKLAKGAEENARQHPSTGESPATAKPIY